MAIRATHRFRVGEIECTALLDGTAQYPAQWLFSGASEAELREKLGGLVTGTDLTVPYTCLLIRAGGKTVLMDTGADALMPTTGELPKLLAEEGVAPEAIDLVVLTHGHPDHIAGAVDAAGKPAFPNAVYAMAKKEWEFWTAEQVDIGRMNVPAELKELLTGCARRSLPPLRAHLKLIEGEAELAPGVSVVPSPGHTPGHLCLLLASGKQQLLCLVDAVLHPLHLEQPSWQTVFDLDASQAAETRRKLLDRAAADRLEVIAYHFPFPGLGHITGNRPGWRWEPAAQNWKLEAGG
jgi:glyoxylase-like metal-dependent hydrolase (beta-lactamase superfamily II)